MKVKLSKHALLILGASAVAVLPGCGGGNGNNSTATNGSQGQSVESMGPDGGGNALDAGQTNGTMDQGANMTDGNTTNSADATGAIGNSSAGPR